jgi:hypothetical protein
MAAKAHGGGDDPDRLLRIPARRRITPEQVGYEIRGVRSEISRLENDRIKLKKP